MPRRTESPAPGAGHPSHGQPSATPLAASAASALPALLPACCGERQRKVTGQGQGASGGGAGAIPATATAIGVTAASDVHRRKCGERQRKVQGQGQGTSKPGSAPPTGCADGTREAAFAGTVAGVIGRGRRLVVRLAGAGPRAATAVSDPRGAVRRSEAQRVRAARVRVLEPAAGPAVLPRQLIGQCAHSASK